MCININNNINVCSINIINVVILLLIMKIIFNISNILI